MITKMKNRENIVTKVKTILFDEVLILNCILWLDFKDLFLDFVLVLLLSLLYF